MTFLYKSEFSCFDEENYDPLEAYAYESDYYDAGESGFDFVFEDPDLEDRDLLRYLIYIISADPAEAGPFMERTRGKWLDEFTTPMSPAEKAFRQRRKE